MWKKPGVFNIEELDPDPVYGRAEPLRPALGGGGHNPRAGRLTVCGSYELPTPVYVIDEARLQANLERAEGLWNGGPAAAILLAQKAFSMFALYPLIGR